MWRRRDLAGRVPNMIEVVFVRYFYSQLRTTSLSPAAAGSSVTRPSAKDASTRAPSTGHRFRRSLRINAEAARPARALTRTPSAPSSQAKTAPPPLSMSSKPSGA